MKIKILEITYKNIRNFKNIKIDLRKDCSEETYEMSLIMMPNGTGKTTSLDLIRLLLNQQGEKVSATEVLSYKPVIGNAKDGLFGVKILIDSKVYGLYLVLDYVTGNIQYKTSIPSTTNGGMRNGWLIEDIKDEFTKNFVDLFVFDGELAKEMLSLDKNQAENAIRYLYRIDKIDTINSTIEELLNDRISRKERKSSTSSERGITKLKNEYEYYKTILKQLEDKKLKLNFEISKHESDLKEYKEKYAEAIEEQRELSTEKKELEHLINIERNNKENKIKEMLIEMKQPESLSIEFQNRLEKLYKNLKILKLPKNVSKQFFFDLAHSKDCICGRPICENEKQHITRVADQYLGEESVGFLNAMKENISSINQGVNINKINTEISKYGMNIIRFHNRIDRVVNKINNNGGDEVKELVEKIDDIKNQISIKKNNLEMLIAKESNNTSNWKSNIDSCKNLLKEAREKYEEAIGANNYLVASKFLKKTINDISTSTLNKLKQRIVQDTNQRISRVIDRDDIVIDKITGGISIMNKKGVSVGQALSIVYCFLGTMFEKSLQKVPFIIDSPCNSLDLEVRANIADILPKMFDQIIVFIISSEKAGFIENLNIKKEHIQYITVYKEDKKSEEVSIKTGFKFFNEFQEVDQVGV